MLRDKRFEELDELIKKEPPLRPIRRRRTPAECAKESPRAYYNRLRREERARNPKKRGAPRRYERLPGESSVQAYKRRKTLRGLCLYCTRVHLKDLKYCAACRERFLKYKKQ